jgi:hypothetical protein
MQQPFRKKEKPAPIRWGVVVRAVLAVCAVALVAFAWYAVIFALPAWRHARQQRAFESLQIQFLVMRVSEIERFVHMPTDQ